MKDSNTSGLKRHLSCCHKNIFITKFNQNKDNILGQMSIKDAFQKVRSKKKTFVKFNLKIYICVLMKICIQLLQYISR